MKITFPVTMEIDDRAIEAFAKDCDADLNEYRKGLVQDKIENLEELVEENGYKVDESKTGVE